MSFRLRAALITFVVGGSAVLFVQVSSASAPTCFGKKATIVGSGEVSGTGGNDVIVGSERADDIQGRGGRDLICAGGGDDFVKAGAGEDKVNGQGGVDTIFGGAGKDHIRGGSAGGDGLVGGPGNDRLLGGPGPEDRLLGGAGDDFMDGGPGYDLAEFWESPVGIEVDLRTDSATGHGTDTIASIEGLVGSKFTDVLVGDELSNDIQGGGGNDTIHALGNTDGGNDILRSAAGDSLLDGGEGADVVSYNVTPWPVTADLATGLVTKHGFGSDTLLGIEHLTGSKENDFLYGNDDDNVIIGNGGDDIMDGRGGIDELAFVDSRMPVVANLAEGTADADWWGSDSFQNFENLIGSIWNDELTGDDGPNLIWGGDRGDAIFGLGGDDLLFGAAGIDALDGGTETDACDGETELNCETDPPTAHFAERAAVRWLGP